jgi:two-component system response regulator LytT
MDRKFNIIFWLVVSLTLLIAFGQASGNYVYSFYFLTFFIPVVILTSWIFNHILISKFLLKKHYKKFVIYSIYVLIISLDIELIIVFLAFLLISLYDFENLSVIVDSYKWMPAIMYFIVILYAFIQVVALLIRNSATDKQDIVKQHIVVRSERKNRNLNLSEIIYIESMADYIQIFLLNGDKVITREKISRLHEKLPGNFLRIHRSFIINMNEIESYTKEQVIIVGKELPISRTYKKETLDVLLKS